jgi:hypothetical protein
LLNGVFSNGSFKEPLLNGYAIFLGQTFTFLLQPITFAPTNCPSYRSLILIQRFKNKNLKTKIPQIINHFLSVFIYKKRDERERQREKEERKKREERPKKIKIEIRPSQLQTAITFDRKLRLRRSTRPRKDNDEIYKINSGLRHYHHFQGKKNSSSRSKIYLKFFS